MSTIVTFTINIAYVLKDSQQQHAIAISQNISKEYDSKVILNTQDTLPHITLYKAKFEEENIDKVLSVVDKVCRNNKQCTTHFLYFEKIFDGWIYLQYKNTEGLLSLHKDLIQKVNPLRNSWIGTSWWRDQSFLTPKHEQYQEQYWSYFILDYFQPHVTVWLIDKATHFDQSNFEINSNLSTIMIDEIAVCTGWKNGTIIDVIESFEL